MRNLASLGESKTKINLFFQSIRTIVGIQFIRSSQLHVVFFYKHIKFSDEARLCLSYHKIKAGVMLTVCLLQ